MELVYCLLSIDRRKTQTIENIYQFRLVQSRPIIVTDKIITSSNCLITPTKLSFSNILLKSVVTVTL